MSKIISIATQAGPYQVPMCDLADYIKKTIEGDTAHRKFNFLMRDKSILMKNSVIPDFMPACSDFKLFTKENPNPSTERRMEVFQQTALQLAYDTSLVAIEKGKIKHEDISHIITVSCTGLYAPGLEILLAEKLGLSNNVQRYAVNFMGCYAAFHAIRLANMIAKQDDKANVLVVCIELCSLHYRNIDEDDNLLSIYLFSDGCAAAIISNENKNDYLKIKDMSSTLVPEGKDDMAWYVGSNGYAMTLTKNIPIYLKSKMEKVFKKFIFKNEIEGDDISHYAIHPGGLNILKAFQEALGLEKDKLSSSYDVLSRYGNMSSATIFFVLEQYLYNEAKHDEHIYAAAFGPGLTIESGLLQYKNE